jgi:hypothetical protein
MSDGLGCKCAAHSEADCSCGVDWRSQREVDLEAENEELKVLLGRKVSQLERLNDDDIRTRLELQQVTQYLCEAVGCLSDVSYENRGDAIRVAALLDRISYAVDDAMRDEQR